MSHCLFKLSIFCAAVQYVLSIGSVGVFHIKEEDHGQFHVLSNYLYGDSFIIFKVICDSRMKGVKVYPTWILQEVACMQDMYNFNDATIAERCLQAQQTVLHTIQNSEEVVKESPPYSEARYRDVINKHRHVQFKEITFQIGSIQEFECGEQHILSLADESSAPYFHALIPHGPRGVSVQNYFWKRSRDGVNKNSSDLPKYEVTRTWQAGMFHFLFAVGSSLRNASFSAEVHIVMRGEYGYLPAINWPLLPYSGVMTFMYLVLGSVWLALWLKTSLHTEKIHIFIGAVAVAGGITNTMMFTNMASINNNGYGIPGLDWLARISASLQSCLTSALLMVVSTGYGITRPELHRHLVVTMAVLTTLSVVTREAVVIVQDEKLMVKYNYPAVDMVVSGLYAFTMLAIAAFIMISSILTFQHLRLRKHTQNVLLFCVFMVTCIVGFIAELVMVAIAYGWFSSCRQNWQWEWIFSNFGSVETLVLLSVLMWLWRPIDRAQSYAFYPLQTEETEGGGDDSGEELVQPASEKTPLDKGAMLSSTL